MIHSQNALNRTFNLYFHKLKRIFRKQYRYSTIIQEALKKPKRGTAIDNLSNFMLHICISNISNVDDRIINNSQEHFFYV